jgi:YVTN family beta-propeller protein
MTTLIKSAGVSLAALAVFTLQLMAANGVVRIIQTNSAGDSVHIIDAATNTVVAEIPGIERAHGAQASPDGNWMWISNEADNTVDVISSKTMTVTKKIPLSGHPNNLAITPDGRKLYVAIAQAPGAVDVIDAAKQAKVRTISVHGGVHNTYVTPDGKYAVAGMIGARNMTVIDTRADMPVWTHYFDLGVRPMAFDANPDGSTRRAYVQLSEFNGFAVVDFETRKEVARIKYPELPAEKRTEGHGGNTAHGIAVTPDNRTLIANSSINSFVYIYSLPDLKLLGQAQVGHSPNWITLTPDGKFAYISLSGANSVAVLDIKTAKVVTEIKTGGQVPKRNATIVMMQ